MIQENDSVIITNKNNIRGVVVGFYTNTNSVDAIVRTDTGNEWIIKSDFLRKDEDDEQEG